MSSIYEVYPFKINGALTMKKFLFFLALLLPLNTYAQEQNFGNPDVVQGIKDITSWIYENEDQTHFMLSRTKLLDELVTGTNITAYSKDGIINRVVTSGFTDQGQLSTEWYYSEGKIIFIYQVFEYFEEDQNENSWKNFKGLWGWESRYYFVNEQLEYHRHRGRNDIDVAYNGNDILSKAKGILAYVKKRAS